MPQIPSVSSRFWCRLSIAGMMLLMVSNSSPRTQAQEKLEYNRDIRPILAENCFSCHGPDSAARKARLRLDQRDAAIQSEAIIPSHPEKSSLVERIFAKDAAEIMPPPKTQKKLSAADKEKLRRWIASGAEYQPHWSFISAKRPDLPQVKNQKWVRNAIDAFILAKLEQEGLRPAPEADRYTLARRVSLDLTGLPPTPEQVKAFVNDQSPNAYEKYVDQLLASPHWGEHRGRYWLDAARYADTHGIHFDNFREVHAYRDWVIKAFNKNQPFDQFTIEQLAGDLLPNRTLDQLVATGFNRCNITTNEGGTIAEEYLVLYTRDRTETVAQVWLGMTANCSTCHDHKYDPLSQKEFYELAAFFNNTTQNAMDGNIKDTPPIIFVPAEKDRARWDVLQKELPEIRKQIENRKQSARDDFAKWLPKVDVKAIAGSIPNKDLHFLATLDEGMGDKLSYSVGAEKKHVPTNGKASWVDGIVAEKGLQIKPGVMLTDGTAGDFENDQGFSYSAWIRLPRNGITGAVAARMDEGPDYRGWDFWVENNNVGTHIIHKWQDDAIKVVAQNPLKPNQWYHVAISYDGSKKAAGVQIYIDGKLQTKKTVFADGLRNSIRTKVPFQLAQRNTTSRIDDLQIQDLRLYQKALSGVEAAQLANGGRALWLLRKPHDKQTDQEKQDLYAWWLTGSDAQYQSLQKQLSSLVSEENAMRGRGTIAHVMQEKNEPPHAYVLFRGEYDKRRDKVNADTPDILPPLPQDLPRNRLGLAQWLVSSEHPLTARVTVNRFWQEVFGMGLVTTAGDFGVAGDLPSHPELLDWLALDFRENGWDIKRFFKNIVMSSTYRQSAVVSKDSLDKDPDNRWLSRGPRFRMDGEMVRDYALATSGLLVRKIGGPSVKPYQPEGVWEAVAMIGSNTRDYRRDEGDKLYRRSMYTFWKRAAPPASMDIFNAPNREFCTVQRERTNTPLQALVTLNDPQFVEAARNLAEATLKAVPDKQANATAERISQIGWKLLCRPLRPEEVKIIEGIYVDLQQYYQQHAEDANKLINVGASQPDASLEARTLAAWTMVANQMMNLDEVLNKQ